MEDYIYLANVVSYFLITVGHTFFHALLLFGYVLLIVCLIAECVLFYRKIVNRSRLWRILGYMVLNVLAILIFL